MRFRRPPTSIAVIAVLLATLTTGVAHAGGFRPARAREKLHLFVNHYRVDHGLHRLRESHSVDRTAQRHAVAMREHTHALPQLQHVDEAPRTTSEMLGRNIGMGPSVWKVFKAWVHSSEHRANMLGRHYRSSGIGVSYAHGTYSITMIYFG